MTNQERSGHSDPDVQRHRDNIKKLTDSPGQIKAEYAKATVECDGCSMEWQMERRVENYEQRRKLRQDAMSVAYSHEVDVGASHESVEDHNVDVDVDTYTVTPEGIDMELQES